MSHADDPTERRSHEEKRAALEQLLRQKEGTATYVPLSYAQQRLWFLDQYEPEQPTYNVCKAFRLNGPLNVSALEQSLGEIVRRHEVLRTSFPSAGGRPVQAIHPKGQASLWMTDLGRIPEADREDRAMRLAVEEARRPFDLARAPLFRVTLVRLGPEHHLFLPTIHHIVSDGWSMGVFAQELSALYEAFCEGKPSPLPELPIQYADYTLWQRQLLQGEFFDNQLSYWKERLGGDLPILQLHTDHPRPTVQTSRGNVQTIPLPRPLIDALSDLGRREGASLFMVLLGAFKVLLFRYTGQEDILVGSPIANRTRAEVEGLIGFFVNTLVLRTGLQGNPTFRELLARVREVALGAFDHQDLPFEKLVEEVQTERDPGRNPLFQVAFGHQNTPLLPLRLPGITVTQLDVDNGTAKFDLALFIQDGLDGTTTAILEYNTGLFEPATANRLLAHYRRLLESIADDPDRPISGLPLLDEAERFQLLTQWNETRATYPQGKCINDLFTEQAARTPHALALVCAEQRLTYRELDERSNQLARFLQKQGVGPDVLVGVCTTRSADMLIGMLAILKAGGAYVPLDPKYPLERLIFTLEDASCSLVLTQRNLGLELPDRYAHLFLDGDREVIARESGEPVTGGAGAGNLAYLIYTSGSTGRPKGVAIEHSSAVNFLYWAQTAFTAEELAGVLATTSICFDLSVFELFAPLSTGGKVILAEHALQLPLLAAAGEITLINTVPSAMTELLRMEGVPGTVLTINLAGEPLHNGLVQEVYQRTAVRRLYNLYGPSETTTYSTYTLCERDAAEDPGIGRPVANTQIFLLDRYLNPVPVGVPGELYIGGAGLARGYLNRPRLTAERFVPSPFGEGRGERLYKTGDLARYLPDGNIELSGRIDHQVKIRGFRIELGEIEAVLAQHPAVRDAVVMAPDAGGGRQLIGYVVPRSHGQGLDEQVRERVWSDQLSHWQTVFDHTYGLAVPSGEAAFNTVGWNSSYTGLPIPAAEMQEWVDRTVDCILALHPRRLLEIGCGTGLLLSRIAPHCEAYWATDFAASALGELERRTPVGPEVRLLHRTADDFSGLDDAQFDTVVINSVTQYFPNIEYLIRVLEGAARVVKPGGCIFLGDVRSLSSLRVFHASIQFAQAPDSFLLPELRRRIEQEATQESELVVDPAFFHALPRRLPAISWAEVELKHGSVHNELTKFRYNAVLHIGEKPRSAGRFRRLDWQLDRLTLETLRQLLGDQSPDLLVVARIPNLRLMRDIHALELIDGQSHLATVGEVRQTLGEVQLKGIDPEAVWALGDEFPYKVRITWSDTGEPAYFDAVFMRRGAPVAGLPASREESPPCPWDVYANNPLQEKLARILEPELRQYLRAKLPDYMVPSRILMLQALPLTLNGKVDRKALPLPEERSRPELITGFMAPRTDAERTIAGAWEDVLRIHRVGIHDNFFDLGGQSLLLVQVHSKLAAVFGRRLSLIDLFQYPTIASLAGYLSQQEESGPLLPQVRERGESRREALRRQQTRRPR